jgi:hypothetical protein
VVEWDPGETVVKEGISGLGVENFGNAHPPRL